MEPITIFLAALAFVGVSHLATTATKGLRKNRQATYQASTRTRSDWYCFFSRSALVGKDVNGLNNQHLSNTIHTDQRQRPSQQSRPRLYN